MVSLWKGEVNSGGGGGNKSNRAFYLTCKSQIDWAYSSIYHKSILTKTIGFENIFLNQYE